MEVSQKMEIEKKRKRLESLTQSLEEERRGENDTHVDGVSARLSIGVGTWTERNGGRKAGQDWPLIHWRDEALLEQ
jgi:hypothetical protein